MENSNSLPQDSISDDKLSQVNDVTDLEYELFDAVFSSPSTFPFKDYFKGIIRKFTQEQISEALQSLQNKKFLSYDSQFSIIKFHLQSVFPYINPQLSDHWLG